VRKIKLSKLAILDLAQIEDYTARTWGEAQSASYMNQFKTRLRWLSENPLLGKNRPEVGQALYSFPEGKHVIYYRANADVLEVSRILHEGMDVENQFV